MMPPLGAPARSTSRAAASIEDSGLHGRNSTLTSSPSVAARAARSAALFGEEDLTRFLQVMLRTFDELNYRQEPRLHLELGLMKLVHLQRLLPLEQILSGLPAAGVRVLPVQAPRPAPVEPPKLKPVTPSPFELDRQRKQTTDDVPAAPVAPVAPVIEPVEPGPAATTADVSFTAVPAQMPKPLSLRPSRWPSAGKVKTATMLKKKTTVTE